MHEFRWCVYDLTDFYEEAQRGNDTEISGYDGVYARRFAATRYLLPLIITGWVDDDGDPVDTPMAQLGTNITALKTAVVGPDGVTGERTVVFSPSQGGTWTTTAQVLDIRKDNIAKGLWVGNLELILTRPWTVT